jgi:tetratricopeptide (TPR) repeat protein
VYESRGDYNNSLDFLNKALEMKELMYGEESLSRSDTLYAIGKIQEKMGDLDETLLTFKEGAYAHLYHCYYLVFPMFI